MISCLYDCFKHMSKTGSVYIYSDPHFGDAEHFKLLKANNKVPEGINSVEELDELQIKNINEVVHKNDTLICLGDIGDINYVKRLKVGHKVLLTGNHDRGAEYYKRVIVTVKYPFALSLEQRKAYKKIGEDWGYVDGPGDAAALGSLCNNFIDKVIKEDFRSRGITDAHLIYDKSDKYNHIKVEYDGKNDRWNYFVESDNKLFDEVYTGPLMISDKIILSHEPIVPCPKYLVNLHGHTHDRPDVYNFNDHLYYNFCAEALGYKPVSLSKLIKDGLLSKVDDIHRVAVDRAIDRKAKRNK